MLQINSSPELYKQFYQFFDRMTLLPLTGTYFAYSHLLRVRHLNGSTCPLGDQHAYGESRFPAAM